MVNPLPHQVDGAAYLAAHDEAYLADPPGLGKTGTAVLGLDQAGAETAAIFVPAIVRHHWGAELAAFSTQGRRVVLANTPTWRQAAGDVYVMSYAQAIQPATREWLSRRRWDALICDEAHTMASPRAQLTRVICGQGIHRKDGVAGRARRVWLLSGTPMRHHLHSLWTSARVLGLTTMPYRAWVDRYCLSQATVWGEQVTGSRRERIPEVRDLFASALLRRPQATIDLPEIRWGRLVLDMDDTDATTRNLRRELKATLSPARMKALLGALERGLSVIPDADEDERVALATLRRLLGDCKAGPAAMLAESILDEGEPALVLFAHHRSVIATLHQRLAKHGAQVIDGSTSSAERARIIAAFQQPDGPRILLCSISAASLGITLTRSARCLIVEPSFSPIENSQAAARLHRLGQRRSVLVSVLGLAGTLDEAIAEIAASKAAAQAAFTREALTNDA